MSKAGAVRVSLPMRNRFKSGLQGRGYCYVTEIIELSPVGFVLQKTQRLSSDRAGFHATIESIAISSVGFVLQKSALPKSH